LPVSEYLTGITIIPIGLLAGILGGALFGGLAGSTLLGIVTGLVIGMFGGNIADQNAKFSASDTRKNPADDLRDVEPVKKLR
jgi:hypothetical protein